MKSQKKYFVILALTGLIPLLVAVIFFIYYINGRSREKGGASLNSHGFLAQMDSNRTEWVRIPKANLQQLADDPQLVSHLKRIDWSAARETDSALVKEQKAISAFIKRFRDRHPEFEEIVLKNPKTGDNYLTVPARALGESFIGVRLVVTMPVRTDDHNQAGSPLLMGYISLDRMDWPDRVGRTDQPDRLAGPTQPNQSSASLADKSRGATKAPITSTKKMALFISVFLAVFIISIPVAMFLFYRKMKKVINPNPSSSNFSNSYSSTPRENRTPGFRRGNKK
jgi:flagellar basal body-associated protein FliL